MNELIPESLINPSDLYFLDNSIVENVYTPGGSKGVMLTYLRKRFSINLGYSSASTVPSSPLNSIQPNDEGSQFAWRIQLSAAF
jgi:hypothetical protein